MERGDSLSVFTDGGARGNPGPAAIAVVFLDEKNQVLLKEAKTIGWATNNLAEYQAFLEALRQLKVFLKTRKFKKIKFYSDSQLLVNQILGIYKVKDSNLKPLYEKAKQELASLGVEYQVIHIYRHLNNLTDLLLNQALDAEKRKNSRSYQNREWQGNSGLSPQG